MSTWKRSSPILYSCLAFIIISWWILAFRSPSPSFSATPPTSFTTDFPLLDQLSPLKREALHQALLGDISLMRSLMISWDEDAQFLIQSGVLGIQSIPQPRKPLTISHVTDDDGNQINLDNPLQRFLPQTYLASTVLLALVPPEQIVAIPRGIRDLPQLYPTALLKQIPLDIDRYNSERLYQASPDLAFVAHYSHPATLEALKAQGISLFLIKNVDTLSDILNAISRIGYLADQKEKTEILLAFVEAAMRSIDNRLRAMTCQWDSNIPQQKILYLHYSSRFAMPTTKNMTGQLLQRIIAQAPIFAIPVIESTTEWKIPLTHEGILHENPEGLIISCLLPEQPPKTSWEGIATQSKVTFIDEMVQQSLTQQIALAYFDIFQSLHTMYCK